MGKTTDHGIIPGMEDRPSDHRRRLLDAMAKSVASKGYAAVTIADLATEARVSKRSFYEQFRDKADCFIALYEAASLQALQALQDARDDSLPWPQQLNTLWQAYLGHLARDPQMLCTLFVDVMAIGPVGLAARRRSATRITDFIVQVSRGTVAPDVAGALIAGVHEWVLSAIETHDADSLPSLAPAAARLFGHAQIRQAEAA